MKYTDRGDDIVNAARVTSRANKFHRIARLRRMEDWPVGGEWADRAVDPDVTKPVLDAVPIAVEMVALMRDAIQS